MFEEFTEWRIPSEIIDISGRDILAAIIGFLFCLMLWGIFDGKEIHVFRHDNKNVPRD